MKTLLKSTALALALSLSFGTVATAKTPVEPVKVSITKSTVQKIKTLDGLNLHLQKDIPNTKPKAIVVISHGLASHSGVFGDFAKTMNQNDIAVYRFDHRGHGKSDGRDSIHIKSYFEMVEDLQLVVKKSQSQKSQYARFCAWTQYGRTHFGTVWHEVPTRCERLYFGGGGFAV